MIYLLIGKDDFSKNEFVKNLLSEHGSGHDRNFEIVDLRENVSVDVIVRAGAPDLFGQKKLIRIFDFISNSFGAASDASDSVEPASTPSYKQIDFDSLVQQIKFAHINLAVKPNPPVKPNSPTNLPGTQPAVDTTGASPGENIFVFIEQVLDKRRTESKKILQNKNIKVLEFELPGSEEFRTWLAARVKKYGLKISPVALELLADHFGAGKSNPGQRLFDLRQADSELQKLRAFSKAGAGPLAAQESGVRAATEPDAHAAFKEITSNDIEALVPRNIDENVFQITNAIADKNRVLAARLMNEYLDISGSGDEKSKIISLSAILAEQFRSMLAVSRLLASQHSNAQVAEAMGYSTGKLAVYMRLSRQFSTQKLLEVLHKLELLDQELKTSQSPAALQFLMIINGAMSA